MTIAKKHHSETLRDLKRVISRYRWRFIMPCFGVMLLTLLAGLLLPRKYEASAIFERRNDLVMSEIAGRGAPESFAMLKRSLVEELSGTPAVDQVIGDLQLVSDGRLHHEDERIRRTAEMQRQDLLYRIHRNTRVHYDMSTPQVDRIRVVFTDTDANRARVVANQLVASYIDRARRQVDQMLGEAADFFDSQVEDYRDRIDVLENQKLEFEIEHAGMLPEDPSDMQVRLTEAESHLHQLQQRHQTVKKQIERLTGQIGQPDGDGATTIVKGKNPDLVRLEQQLRRYLDELDQAVTIRKMTDQHPIVVSLHRKIDVLNQAIAETPGEVITERVFAQDPKNTHMKLALIEALAERDALAGEISTTRRAVQNYSSQAGRFLPVRTEYRKIERQIESAERQLTFWEDNLRQVTMALTAELGQRGISMDFIKPSARIQRPSSPDLMQVLFATAVLGIASGVGCVLLADRTDQTFHTVDDTADALDVPVLGAVAEIISGRQSRVRWMTRKVVFPAAITVMFVVLIGAAYVNYLSLRRPYVFGDLQSSLLQPLTGNPESGGISPGANTAPIPQSSEETAHVQ
ncbi:MAG: hypothetical protein CMJ49_07385 [Planctomycetaceae bacterium]|nr:hypothetical protein [Planctomycetaceae bacterium]